MIFINIIYFILLLTIIFLPIYIIHKYYDKKELYILTIIYSVLSFISSFKLIKIFGIDINSNIIISSGLLTILYYFTNRYKEKSNKKIIYLILGVTLSTILLFTLSTFMIPSLYDKTGSMYENILFNNLPLLILYPISLAITLLLSNYCYIELKDSNKYKVLKTIAITTGILFIEAGILFYFTYAMQIKFDIALKIAIDSYIVKTIIMTLYLFLTDKIFKIKKVKE